MRRVAASAVAIVAVAGCGDSEKRLTKAQYESKLKAIGVDTSRALEDGGNPSTPQAFARFLAKEQAGLRLFSAKVAKVRPPSEVQHAQDEFVVGMRGAARDLDPLIRMGRRGQRISGTEFERRLRADTATRRHLSEARAMFQAKGYQIGSPNSGGPTP